MPKPSPNLLFPQMQRLSQHNDYYCGPAVLAMLLSPFNHQSTQDELVAAANAQSKIKTDGVTVAELGLAVHQLYPDLSFWFKNYSSLSELSRLINFHHYPVGVEWQGVFTDDGDDCADDDGDDDPGHYGVVTGISTSENWLTLADPYHNRGLDKQFTILEFERRWWDINLELNPQTGKREEVDDYHTLFLITPRTTSFPSDLNLICYNQPL